VLPRLPEPLIILETALRNEDGRREPGPSLSDTAMNAIVGVD
jgi:hypothetical protein